MADIAALNDAISNLNTQAGNVTTAVAAVEAAAIAAATRVGSGPVPVDYQPQIDAIGAINTVLGNAITGINQATATANGILP